MNRALVAIAALACVLEPLAALADGVSPRVVSLPRGPGSVEGLGSNFEANASTGGASYQVSFRMPPAVGNLVPQLGIAYSGGAGASAVGLGWSFDVPTIRRRTENGLPRYDETDTFAIAGAGADGELVPMADGTMRLRFEGAFVRVRRRDNAWEVRERSGLAHYFGETSESLEGADGHTIRWNLTRTTDPHGHEIRYIYMRDGGTSYLTEVRYGGEGPAQVVVALVYEARPDVLTSYQSADRVTLARRLASVVITRGAMPVSRYRLSYSGDAGLSRLADVSMVGADDATSLPTIRFTYGAPRFDAMRVVSITSAPGQGLLSADNDLADLNGDGAADLLATSAGRFTVYLNQAGESFAAPFDMTRAPSVSLSQTGMQLADMDGDAAVDLVTKQGLASDGFRYYPGGDARQFGDARAFARNPSFTFEDPEVRLVDLDFDRRTDVLITTPSGAFAAYNTGGDFTLPTALPAIDPAQPVRLNDPHVRLADMNGDRLQDIVSLRNGALIYWPARGRGLFGAAVSMRDVPSTPIESELTLADLNGDGLQDVVRVGVNVVEIWLNLANGAFATSPVTVSAVPERRASTAVRFADMNGNGSIDVVWVDVSGPANQAWRYLDVVGDGAPGQLTGIDNGLGLTTTIRYRASAAFAADDARAGRPWRTRLPTGMALVSEVRRDDGLGATEVTRYAYRDGLYDGPTREFRGFGRTTRTDVGDAEQPSLVSEIEFDLGIVDEARKGRLIRTTRGDERSGVFDQQDSTWEVVTVGTATDGRAVRWARMQRTEIATFERTIAPRIVRTETAYDEFGNATLVQEWGVVEGDNVRAGDDERVTRRTFAINATDWILDRVASEEVQDGVGRRFSARRIHYDGEPLVGLPLGQVSRGDESRVEAWVGPNDRDWVDLLRQRHDRDGNVTEQVDAEGRRSLIEWDRETRTFPTSEWIPFADGREIRWRVGYDARWGVPTSAVMPNGSRVEMRYDGLGRRTDVIDEGDSRERPTIRYAYVLGGPVNRVEMAEREVSGADAVRTTITLVDGARRERVRLVEYEGGGWLAQRFTRVGARGWPTIEARPFTNPRADVTAVMHEADGVRRTYDALGRVVATSLPDGARTRIDYAPDRRTTWDANDLDPRSPQHDTPVVEIDDGLDRVIERRFSAPTGDAVWRFRHDALGRVRERTDPLGIRSTYDFNGLGYLTTVVDPDAGRRTFAHDSAGRVERATNARGQTMTWRYDEAGRAIEHDSDGDGQIDTRWTFDRGCDNGMAQLCRLEEPELTTEYAYDARGRRVRTAWSALGRRWEARDDFDALGRVTRHTYPDGSSVDYRYNVRGLVDSIGDIVQSTEYEPSGVVRTRRYGNGVRETRRFDERGRPNAIGYVGPTGQIYEDLTRRYDAMDNILEIVDGRANRSMSDDRTEHFEYDEYDRLHIARGAYGRITQQFDAAHRLVERTADFNLMNLGRVVYPDRPTDPAPHAPRRLGTLELTYDADGNAATVGGRALRWSARNHAVEVPTDDGRTVSSWYDERGSRRIERVRGGGASEETTVFLSDTEEIRNGRLIRYVRDGGEVLFVADAERPRNSTSAMGSLGARGPPAEQWGLVVALVLLALGALSQRSRPRACRSTWASSPCRPTSIATARWRFTAAPAATLALLAMAPSCGGPPPARPIRSDDGVVVLRDLSNATLGVVDAAGAYGERDHRYPGGLVRTVGTASTGGSGSGSGSGFRSYRRYATGQRQTVDALAFVGPRVLLLQHGVWLSPASDSVMGSEEAPYTYCDGNPVSRVDLDGHSWGDWLLHYTERALSHAAGAIDSGVRAAAVVGASGIPVISQVANTVVASVRLTEAATGTAITGQQLSSQQRIQRFGEGAIAVATIAATTTRAMLTARVAVGGRAVATTAGAAQGANAARGPPCAGSACAGSGACFVAGTLVATRDGSRAIEKIAAGDDVLARDEETGEIGWQRVARTFVTPNRETIEVGVRGVDGERHALVATPEHPFWVAGRGWAPAGSLREGDVVVAMGAREMRVVEVRARAGRSTVFNLEVERWHTYFVGESAAWVHNACGPGGNSRSDQVIRRHLRPDRELVAARRELRGEVVARRRSGEPYDHVHEVRDAQNGLLRRIREIQRSMSSNDLDPSTRVQLQRELGRASRALDNSERFVPRATRSSSGGP